MTLVWISGGVIDRAREEVLGQLGAAPAPIPTVAVSAVGSVVTTAAAAPTAAPATALVCTIDVTRVSRGYRQRRIHSRLERGHLMLRRVHKLGRNLVGTNCFCDDLFFLDRR